MGIPAFSNIGKRRGDGPMKEKFYMYSFLEFFLTTGTFPFEKTFCPHTKELFVGFRYCGYFSRFSTQWFPMLDRIDWLMLDVEWNKRFICLIVSINMSYLCPQKKEGNTILVFWELYVTCKTWLLKNYPKMRPLRESLRYLTFDIKAVAAFHFYVCSGVNLASRDM